jgi:hypothetical protein
MDAGLRRYGDRYISEIPLSSPSRDVFLINQSGFIGKHEKLLSSFEMRRSL